MAVRIFLALALVLSSCLAGLVLLPAPAHAATITSTAAGGTWATTGTWVGGVVPATGDAVIIATTGAGAVDIAANLTQTAAGSVTVNSGATLTTSGGSITFGALTINSGGTATMYRPLTVSGATSISGTINFGSTSGTARAMTFTGAVTLNSGAVWNETTTGAAATFSFGNSFTNNATTFTAQNTAHGFTGAGMTLSGTTATVIPTVTFTGNYTNSGTLTVSTLLTVTGGAIRLTNNGTVTASAALSGTGGVTQGATGILNIGGTSAITTLTATAAGNTVNYTGAAQTAKVTTYDHLTLSNAGIKTFATTPTVNDTLSLEGTATVVVTGAGVVTYGPNANLQYNTATARTATTEEWISPFAATGGVVIANTGTITMNAAKVFNAGSPLTINSGASLDMSSFLLTLNGNLVNNGGTTSGSGGVTITGTAAQSIGSFTTSGTVSMTKTAGTATFTGNVSGGALTLNGSGGTLDLGAGLTHTFTGTWTRTNGTLLGNSSTLNLGGAVSGTGGTFTAGTGTVNYNGAGTQTVAALTYYRLTTGGSGIKTLGGAVTVNNTLTIGSGTTLDVAASNYALNVGGNWVNDGAFTPQSGTVTLNGAAAQAISGTSTTGFYNLTISNSSGVTLGGAVTVHGLLTLSSGNITTGSASLAIDSGGSVTRSSGHIVGNLVKAIDANGTVSRTFEVGTGADYTPLNITLSGVAGSGSSGQTLTASTTSGEHPAISGSGINSAQDVNRYWTLNPTGSWTFTSGDVTLNFVNSDLDSGVSTASFIVRQYTSGTWSAPPGGVTAAANYTIGKGFTSFGDYAVGEPAAAPNQPPVLDAVGLYQTNPVAAVTTMTPQVEYAVKVTVSDPDTLNDLDTVTVTIFYEASGVYNPAAIPGSGNTQTAAILTCTVGASPAWSLSAGVGTTWSIISASCVQPGLTGTSGDFWFQFKPGKVATAAADKWFLYARATDKAAASGDNHQDNLTMNWYGEITLNTVSVDFGTITLGSDFSANSQTSISVTYICNGGYSQQVKTSSPWSGGGNTVTLNTAGSPGPGEFSLKADDTAVLGNAVIVATDYVTIGTGTQTSESGTTQSACTLWLKPGATGLPAVLYNGTIFYGITP